jgi:HD superfamily phosphodiesterase
MEKNRIDSELLKEIEIFVNDLILKESSKNLTYHTVNHTTLVVKNAGIIGAKENFNADEMNILLTSAWFHDTGYIKKYLGHEKESMAIATDFLRLKSIDEETINLVSECIMATTFPQKASNKIAEALCDADMMHLGKEYYFEFAEKLRQELKAKGIKTLKKTEFEKESIQFFKAHTFYTDYCKREISSMKENNLKRIQKSMSKRELKTQIKSAQDKKYSRGVDSMFKLTARNQISLSAIADNKSNILISLNGIIISLGLVAIASKFKEEPAIISPSVIFILFSLSTIILAILSTRPNISSGEFSRDDIKQGKVNMLFFGNFYKMKLEEYERAIKEMIDNDQYLYATMAKDQYFLGKVLARKYKLLRWAYNLFMVGIVISVIAFLLVFLQL